MKFSRASPRASWVQGSRDGAVLPPEELLQHHKNLSDPRAAEKRSLGSLEHSTGRALGGMKHPGSRLLRKG